MKNFVIKTLGCKTNQVESALIAEILSKNNYNEVKNIEDYVEKDVTLTGWIKNHRKQKEFGFIDFSDGTCFEHMQIVYDNTLPNFEQITKLHIGSAIKVVGTLKEKNKYIIVDWKTGMKIPSNPILEPQTQIYLYAFYKSSKDLGTLPAN